MMIEEKCFEPEDEPLPEIDTSGIDVVECNVVDLRLLDLMVEHLPDDLRLSEFRRLAPAFEKVYVAGFNAGFANRHPA